MPQVHERAHAPFRVCAVWAHHGWRNVLSVACHAAPVCAVAGHGLVLAVPLTRSAGRLHQARVVFRGTFVPPFSFTHFFPRSQRRPGRDPPSPDGVRRPPSTSLSLSLCLSSLSPSLSLAERASAGLPRRVGRVYRTVDRVARDSRVPSVVCDSHDSGGTAASVAALHLRGGAGAFVAGENSSLDPQPTPLQYSVSLVRPKHFFKAGLTRASYGHGCLHPQHSPTCIWQAPLSARTGAPAR
jgi:hypothetical protein